MSTHVPTLLASRILWALGPVLVCVVGTLSAADTRANALLTESTLQYQYPPFDQIKSEDYTAAFAEGMTRHLAEVRAIADSTDAPTFTNTIVALERSGLLLSRVNAIFSNQIAANTNPTLQKIDEVMAPKLAAHNDAILLDPKLFARVQAVYDQRAKLNLDPESAYLVERYYKDFIRAGAKLSEADKTRLKAINAEIASLGTTFTHNLLDETNASAVVVDDRAELAGLSDSEIAGLADAAKEDGHPGKYEIRLQNTTGQPIVGSLQNRALRQRILEASLARGNHGGKFDNRAVVDRIVLLRAQHAKLLGYANHAAYQLEEQTAGDVGRVNKLLADLTGPAVANARREAADIQQIIDHEHGGFAVAAWDWDLYAEKVRLARYAFDESQIKPYFELNHVLQDGVFYAATRLYGLTFKERHDLPVYQPDVRVFEVFNADGSSLALLILDYYARPSKRGGAWMDEYVSQSRLLGLHPVVANHLNIAKPPAGQPTLLTFDEVRTAFHEFGHALHGMFSNVEYPRFSGTNVPRDFVEFPSQVNEMWAVWPEVLAHYARHYQTGAELPTELLNKVIAAQKFNQGYMTTEYLAASLLDQAWHQLNPEQVPPTEGVVAFEQAALRNAHVDFPPVPPRYRTTYFSHIFTNDYSAGYYSYIWAEVLDADTVEYFKQHGGLTRENGDRFRSTLLSRGGSAEALGLFRNFVGREPYVEPLLVRRGLTPTTGSNP